MNGDFSNTISKIGAAARHSSTNREAPCLIVICEYGRLTAPALRVALGDLQEVTVGRASRRSLARQGTTATLSIPDDEISRKHLVVRRQPNRWEVADLGSKNGILVNGEPARITTLTDGDMIEVGGTLLMFREEAGGPDGATDRDLAAGTATPIAFGCGFFGTAEPGVIPIGCTTDLGAVVRLLSCDLGGLPRPFLDEKPCSKGGSCVSGGGTQRSAIAVSTHLQRPVAIQVTRIMRLSAVVKDPHPSRFAPATRSSSTESIS